MIKSYQLTHFVTPNDNLKYKNGFSSIISSLLFVLIILTMIKIPTQIGSNQKMFFTCIEEVHHDAKGLSRLFARNQKIKNKQ